MANNMRSDRLSSVVWKITESEWIVLQLSSGMWTAWTSLFTLCSLLLVVPCQSACDFPPQYDDLQVRCVCGTGGNLRLTVQCSSIDLPRLVEALKSKPPLDLLAVINGSIPTIEDGAFNGLDVRGIQLSSVGLSNISPLAFQGLERTLSSLNFEMNEIRDVPTQSLKRLNNLKELDLSRNRITVIPDAAFSGLTLNTLKLSDNPLQISDAAFKGLESSLHNLNLKGTGQMRLPTAVKQLSEVSFLDLAQNKFAEILPDDFQNLRQLTALTLERNLVSSVDPRAFTGLNGTLSSLSLLNNKIEEFPTRALSPLQQLRVLDMGFNRMRSIPEDAFSGNPLLTLLALDGNPLNTLSEKAFVRLNSTLRGLSVGGSTLVCDCKIRWIIEWVRKFDLQVTSRERNPQFCGRPVNLRRRTLPQMSPLELRCDDEIPSTTTPIPPSSTTAALQNKISTQRPGVTASGRDLRAPRTSSLEQLRLTEVIRRGTELTVKWEGFKEDNLIRARASAPIHAMYRIFGEPHFQLGSTANPASGWTQFLIPESKPVVVCVVDTAQAATLSANSIPRNQCNEVIAEKVSESQLNKIIIGSSAAVCGMIIIAVIVFVCCSKRSGRKQAAPRPAVKSEHEWETSSLYSGRSIPRARAYHGSVNPSYLHDPRTPDDVQSFRSLPPARAHRGGHMMGVNRDLHSSQIALSQLSGPHSFLGTYAGEPHHNGWGNQHWEGADAYSERHAPSRMSYGKDNFG